MVFAAIGRERRHDQFGKMTGSGPILLDGGMGRELIMGGVIPTCADRHLFHGAEQPAG